MTSLGKSLARLLIENCALYLASILLLLSGIMTATHSTGMGDPSLFWDLPFLGVIHLYEVCLLGVLFVLFKVPSRREDGYYVALAALVLTLDPTLFTQRFYTHTLEYGLALNAGVFLLASAKIWALSQICKVPLNRSHRLSFGLTHAWIFLGTAPLFMESFASKNSWMYLLSWFPLALTFCLPSKAEFEAPCEDPVDQASVRRREFSWAVLFLPFVGGGLHLQQAFDLHHFSFSPLHLAPWLFAMALGLGRAWDRQAGRIFQVVLGLCLGGIFFSSVGPQVQVFGWIQPFQLTLLVSAGVSAILALRSQDQRYAWASAGFGLGFLLGSSPQGLLRIAAGPLPLFAVAVLSWSHFCTSRSRTAYALGSLSTSAWVSLSTTESVASLVTLHLLGWAVLAAAHVFPELEEEENPWFGSTLALLLVTDAMIWKSPAAPSVLKMFLIFDPVLLLGATIYAPRLRYRLAVGSGTAVLAAKGGILDWIHGHALALSLVGSFGSLGLGLWVSIHKEELLRDLGDQDPGGDQALV